MGRAAILDCPALRVVLSHPFAMKLRMDRHPDSLGYFAVALTNSSTPGTSLSSRTAWGLAAALRDCRDLPRASALTAWLALRSSKAWRPMAATCETLFESGASSAVMSEAARVGWSFASLSRQRTSQARACCQSAGEALPEAIRAAKSLNLRAVSLSGGTASTRWLRALALEYSWSSSR